MIHPIIIITIVGSVVVLWVVIPIIIITITRIMIMMMMVVIIAITIVMIMVMMVMIIIIVTITVVSMMMMVVIIITVTIVSMMMMMMMIPRVAIVVIERWQTNEIVVSDAAEHHIGAHGILSDGSITTVDGHRFTRWQIVGVDFGLDISYRFRVHIRSWLWLEYYM
jgi:hypothetical protein